MKVIYFQLLLREGNWQRTAFRTHFVFVYVLACFSHVRLCDRHGSSAHEIPGENSGVSCHLHTPGGPEIKTGFLTLQAGMQSLPSEQSGKACPLGWKSAKFWRPEPHGRFWDPHAMFLCSWDVMIWPHSCGRRNRRLSCLFEFLFSASGSLVNLTLGSTG